MEILDVTLWFEGNMSDDVAEPCGSSPLSFMVSQKHMYDAVRLKIIYLPSKEILIWTSEIVSLS